MGNRPAQALYHNMASRQRASVRINPRHQGGCNYQWKYFPDAEGASLDGAERKIETLRCESAFQRFLQGDEEKWKNHLNWRIQS